MGELAASNDPRINMDVVSVNMTKQFYTYVTKGQGGDELQSPLYML